jgi:hypothetical protein
MTDSELKFHIEEYKELRKEVLEKITRTETLIQYSVLLSAAVFSWLATRDLSIKTAAATVKVVMNSDHPLIKMAWWIPFLSVVTMGLLGLVQYSRVEEMGKYLMKLEDAMGNSQLGWEKYLSAKPYTISSAFAAAWFLILVATASVPIYQFFAN